MFFFFLSFSFLDDFFFGLWFLTVALLAWRVVFFFFLVGIGLGLGLYTTWGKVLPSTGLHYRYMLPKVLIDEMGRGMEGYGRAGGGVRTLFAGNREPTEICHCWPRGVYFFCFYEVGWLVVLPYFALPLS